MQKIFSVLLVIGLFIGLLLGACGKSRSAMPDQPDSGNLPIENGVNMNIASSGEYPTVSGKIYVDENLKVTTQSKAKFYLIKELLGRELVPNDEFVFDYWKNKSYFKETPVIMYIYKYYDVKDNQPFFFANANELEGFNQYIFHGLASWAYKDKDNIDENNTLKLTGGYSLGKPDGEFKAFDQAGNVVDDFGYHNGQRYTNKQKSEDIYRPLIGFWEGELKNDANWQMHTQVYNWKDNGSMEFYRNIYYNEGMKLPANWELSNEPNIGKGSWKYIKQTDNSGVMEFYYRGKLVQKAEIKIINENQFRLKSTFLDPMFDQTYVGKELIFKRKRK